MIDKYTYKKITYKGKVIIIEDKIVLKKEKDNIKDIYDYLLSRKCDFVLYPIKIDKDYSIYKYIVDINTIKEEKAINLINLLAELQNRTTTFKKYSLDEVKKIYEDNNNLINNLFQYYNDLEETFSMYIYPAPYQLLYLENVSKIYNLLEYSKSINQKWYDLISKNMKKRVVLLHNHLSLEHFIGGKIINFNYADYGIPIYDFKYFYKKHYKEIDMLSIFNYYQQKYTYTESELLLFFLEIMIPKRIEFTNNNLENTIIVNNLINYIDATREFILKQQEKHKKEDNKEFNK